jgi:hypothetical protein
MSGHCDPSSNDTGTAGGLGWYFLLLAVQTAGAVIVLVNGVPIYRQMVAGAGRPEPHPGILWWAVAAVTLIQGAYWLRVRLNKALPAGGYTFIGHIAQFVGRLSFIFASSTFTVVFLARFEELSMPPQRVVMVLALLFSLFCYSLELERLARALHGNGGRA